MARGNSRVRAIRGFARMGLAASAALLAGCRTGGHRRESFDESKEYLARAFQTTLDRGEDPTLDHKRVDLDEIMAHPRSFTGVAVRVRATFHQVENIWTHFFTEFVPEDYYAFSVWPSRARLWVKDERMHDLPFVFIRKDNRSLRTLLNLTPYATVEIQGVVRSHFNNNPWIEVEYLRRTDGPQLNGKSLQHLILASEAVEAGDAKIVLAETDDVLKMELPPYARSEALRLRARAHVQMKAWESATGDLDQARALDPGNHLATDDQQMVRDLRSGKAKLPATAEDRQALAARAQTLEQQLAAKDAQVSQLTTELGTLKQQVSAAPAATTETETKLKAAEEEKAKLAQDLEALRAQLQAASEGAQKAQEAEAKVAAAEAEKAKLAQELEAAKAGAPQVQELSAKVEELSKQNGDLQAQVAGLREQASKAGAAGGEVEALKTELDKLKQEQAAGAQKLNELQAQNAGLLAEREDLTKKITELEEQNKQLQQKIKDLEEELNKKGQDK